MFSSSLKLRSIIYNNLKYNVSFYFYSLKFILNKYDFIVAFFLKNNFRMRIKNIYWLLRKSFKKKNK